MWPYMRCAGFLGLTMVLMYGALFIVEKRVGSRLWDTDSPALAVGVFVLALFAGGVTNLTGWINGLPQRS